MTTGKAILTLSLCLAFNASAAAPLLTDGESTISVKAVAEEIRSMPEDLQAHMIGNAGQLAKLVGTLLLENRIAEAAVKEGYMDKPVVRARLARQQRVTLTNAYLEDRYAEQARGVPDFTAVARERYLADDALYLEPEAIRVAHILFRFAQDDAGCSTEGAIKEKALGALQRLRQGADFAKLATELSEDPGSAKTGGELPDWVGRNQLVPPFERAAFALKPGEISDVVRTRYGFHIIKLLEHRPVAKRPFEAVKDQIIGQLRNDWLAGEKHKLTEPFGPGKTVTLPADLESLLRRELAK